MLAVLAGATSYRGILTFIGVHRERLNAAFGARFRRAPAVSTLRGLFQALEPADLEAAFREHARTLAERAPASGPPVVALDGKTLKRSFDHLNDQAAAHVLGAFACDAASILAHQEVGAVPEEVPAAQALIGALGLRGVLFTADALHCQKNLRGRRPHRQRPPGPAEGQPARLARGRREPVRQPRPRRPARDDGSRPARPPGAPPGRGLRGGGPAPAGVAQGDRPRGPRSCWCKDTRTGLWRPRREVAYYVSQARLDAAGFGRAIRAHWGIENRNHHVRDRTLGEDGSRIRRRPGVFARLRSFALNILRANGVSNVSEAVYVNALSLDRLLAHGLPKSEN